MKGKEGKVQQISWIKGAIAAVAAFTLLGAGLALAQDAGATAAAFFSVSEMLLHVAAGTNPVKKSCSALKNSGCPP